MHPPQHATPIPSFRENVTAPHLVPIKGKFSDAASEFSPKRQPTGFEGVLLSHHRSHPERHFTLRFRCHLLTPTPRAPFLLFQLDRKSTRLNSSHLVISYAVFCLKKK